MLQQIQARMPGRAPAQIAGFLVFRLAAACAMSALTAPVALPKELPLHAIVNGHPVQPREGQLQALGHPDLTAQQQQEVSRLYQQILRASQSDTTG